MSALATPVRPQAAPDVSTEGPGGRPTLDDLLASAWEGLGAGVQVSCLVCGGSMEPEPGGGGRCHGCGSELS